MFNSHLLNNIINYSFLLYTSLIHYFMRSSVIISTSKYVFMVKWGGNIKFVHSYPVCYTSPLMYNAVLVAYNLHMTSTKRTQWGKLSIVYIQFIFPILRKERLTQNNCI